jgi:ParB family chromosome partitioning protein
VRRQGEHYQIVAGERRWRAATRAGLHEIPAIVKELSDAEALQVALIENIQRQDLDALEEAEAYHRLLTDHGLTQEGVAAAVGKSRVTVTNSLRLLRLPEAALAMLADGRLTAGHARALMSISDEAALCKLANDVAARKLSVRDTERLARLVQAHAKPQTAAGRASPAERQVEDRVQRALGTKVRLRHRRGKGRIEIFFHSLDELDRVLDKIAP